MRYMFFIVLTSVLMLVSESTADYSINFTMPFERGSDFKQDDGVGPPFVPLVGRVSEILTALNKLPPEHRQRGKNSFFSRLIREFQKNPSRIIEAKSELMGRDPKSPFFEDDITLVISAMGDQSSPLAQEALCAIMIEASLEQEIMIFQSVISMGSHTAPSSLALDALAAVVDRVELLPESKSAALMALGSVARNLGPVQTAGVVKRLLAMSYAGDETLVQSLAAMANHGDSRYFERVKDVLFSNVEVSVLKEVARTIGHLNHPEAEEVLLSLLDQDPDESVAASAIEALGQGTPSYRVVKQLGVHYNRATSVYLKESVINVLAKAGDEESKLILRQLANFESNEHLKALAQSY
ncbi:MAG: HEAT repeat domain-containing protein [Deltaproteobacteria bacterium]|nr:HEAT repeat domain-containing protein [Deltaproteobacteria bacterium]